MERKKKERYDSLRKILLEKKKEMWNELRIEVFEKLGSEYHDQFDIPQDVEDQALADLIEETGLTLADMRAKKLTMMDEAMQRLQEGSYGICSDCGGEIEEERLKVMPFAPNCIVCQRKKEM